MNARTKATVLSQRASAFVRRLPRPGQAAFVIARLAAAVVAVALAALAFPAVLIPAGFFGGIVGDALWLFVKVVVIVVCVVVALDMLAKFYHSSNADPKKGAPPQVRGRAMTHFAIHGMKALRGATTLSVALTRLIVPFVLRSFGVLVGLAALWVGLGLQGIADGLSTDARPTSPPMAAAHDLVQMCLHSTRGTTTAPTGESGPDRKAIEKSIKEGAPDKATRWKFRSFTQTFSQDVYEYRAIEQAHKDFAELQEAWIALAPTMSYNTRIYGIKCEGRISPEPHFLAIVPRDAVPFPALPATALVPFIEAHRDEMIRHPLRFCLGLTAQAEPLWAEFCSETAHFLVAGSTGSGKSRSAVFSPLAQLLTANSPAQMRLWLLDSNKREASAIFENAPHLEQLTVAEDGEAVLDAVREFVAAMDARFRVLAGRREWRPSDGPWHLLVIEEWYDLNNLLAKEQREEFIRLVGRVGTIGRAGGFHLILVTQKANVRVLPPELKSNLMGRVCGYFANSQDYGIVLDTQKVSLPRVTGRLAVMTEEGITICQGLFGDNDTIQRLISSPRPEKEGRQGPEPTRPADESDFDESDFAERPEPQPGPAKPFFTERPTSPPTRPAANPDAATSEGIESGSLIHLLRMIWEKNEADKSWAEIDRKYIRSLAKERGCTIRMSDAALGKKIESLKNAKVLTQLRRKWTLTDRSWDTLSGMLLDKDEDDKDEDEDA